MTESETKGADIDARDTDVDDNGEREMIETETEGAMLRDIEDDGDG